MKKKNLIHSLSYLANSLCFISGMYNRWVYFSIGFIFAILVELGFTIINKINKNV